MMHSSPKSIRGDKRELAVWNSMTWIGVNGSYPTGVNDMDYQIAFAATVATASFLFFMLIVHRT
ncbi:hypothetical protein ACOJBM_14255 [Rhizobium beringeri]|jgi:hypothetical protein|uniref:hypothetical protein n=1 Tax=Rhizobium TaxID=379 RepID=UPI0013EF0DFA|nr:MULTISPECIES: hypothetical protein [Rhizobium]WSG76299.1 hypothetical protein U8P80_12405 [Rhizobium beringeri]WSH16494.1 hypothetical protein U8P74_12405 [Rhizobium beringeri]